MPRIIFFLLCSLVGCIDPGGPGIPLPEKDYSPTHAEASSFCKKNGYNENFYFLADMGVHSGRKRFYVYDFKQGRITHSNIVTHGSCDTFEENTSRYEKARFSNRDGSHCSSLGKYKIGKRDYSSWGIKIKYWLHGLEETNSNAQGRVVVLHSWDAVADEEIYPDYSPLSWGCPAVSDNFMKKLDTLLQNADKPVLLWIIDSAEN